MESILGAFTPSARFSFCLSACREKIVDLKFILRGLFQQNQISEVSVSIIFLGDKGSLNFSPSVNGEHGCRRPKGHLT